MKIRPLEPADWDAVRTIYELGIATNITTFEDQTPEWQSWHEGHLSIGRLVATLDQQVVGWVALSPVSKRPAYAGVAEVTLYVHPDFGRKGIGRSLMESVITDSEKNGIWTLNAVILSENTASLQLFEKSGFRTVGYREKIAQKHGVWKDTVLMERRSNLPAYR